MPGHHTILFPDDSEALRIEVEPEEDGRDIYFTDQRPRFTYVIENVSEKPVRGQISWFIGRGTGKIEHVQDGRENVDIDPGETHEIEVQSQLLSFQCSGVVGVRSSTSNESDDEIELNRPAGLSENVRSQNLIPLYSFTIWDEEFYSANYRWPRRAQYVSAVLAVLIVLVGTMQLLLP